MPLAKAFHIRTANIYSSMVARFATKQDKNGRIIRHGRLVPFDLEMFRNWALVALGGKPDGCALCYYCRRPLCSQDFRVEHKVPPKRAGSLDFDNLVFACDDCNRLKGSLTAEEFVNFCQMMDVMLNTAKLTIEGYNDIFSRLKGQNIVLDAWRRGNKKRKAAAAPKPELFDGENW